MRRRDELIAVDLAGETRLLDHRDLPARQGNVLLQTQRDLRIGKEIIDAVVESDTNKRQSVKRGRAYIAYARRDVEAYFHGNGVVPLHLLGRESRGLRGDINDDRRGIWISLDVEARKGDKSAGDENEKAEQHDGSPSQAECDDAPEHGSPRCRSLRLLLEHDLFRKSASTFRDHAVHRALAVASILLRKIAPS